jgi:hypothetical protein
MKVRLGFFAFGDLERKKVGVASGRGRLTCRFGARPCLFILQLASERWPFDSVGEWE